MRTISREFDEGADAGAAITLPCTGTDAGAPQKSTPIFRVVAGPPIGGGTDQNGIMGLSTTGPEDGCVGSTAEL